MSRLVIVSNRVADPSQAHRGLDVCLLDAPQKCGGEVAANESDLAVGCAEFAKLMLVTTPRVERTYNEQLFRHRQCRALLVPTLPARPWSLEGYRRVNEHILEPRNSRLLQRCTFSPNSRASLATANSSNDFEALCNRELRHMRDPEPFLLSASEKVTTGAMHANGTIPHDRRCIEVPWQNVAIFNKIVEIGSSKMRVITSSAVDEKMRWSVVVGPEATKRLNERSHEIQAFFATTASSIQADEFASQDAA